MSEDQKEKEINLAFIDGQNLYLGTTQNSDKSWRVDLVKFRIHLLVDFLLEENRLKKILFPNKRYASSLYKKIGSEYFDNLDKKDIKQKIQKEKGSLGS